MNEIKVFENEEFGSVRTVEVGDKVLFCGSDVAKALGYSNPRKALSDHCKGVTKRYAPHPQNLDKKIEMSFIPEADIYRLIVKSKLPSAEKFESWVFEDVLPSIRKHGAYMTPDVLEQALTSPDFIIKLATQLKDEQEKRKALEQKVEEDKPKIEYHDCVLNKSGLMATSIIAKDLGMSAQKLNKILNDKKIIYKDSTKVWKVYADYEWLMTEGYADYVSYTEEGAKPSLKWTEKGRQWIMKQLGCA